MPGFEVLVDSKRHTRRQHGDWCGEDRIGATSFGTQKQVSSCTVKSILSVLMNHEHCSQLCLYFNYHRMKALDCMESLMQ